MSSVTGAAASSSASSYEPYNACCIRCSAPAHEKRSLRRLICCSLPGRRARRNTTPVRPSLQSHDSVLVVDAFQSPCSLPKHESNVNPIKSTVRKLMRRASMSFKPGSSREKGPLVISGVVKRGRTRGDGESGIMFDERDTDDGYFDKYMQKRSDFVQILPAEITAQIMSYLDHRTLVSCEMVSRSWREAAQNRHVWREVFHAEHGPWESRPGKDWKNMFVVNKELNNRWQRAEMSYKYLKGHTDSVYCVQFDDTKVITGSRDRSIRVWDIKTGECVQVVGPESLVVTDNIPFTTPRQFHSASILCLQFDAEILITGSSDNTCMVWSLPDYGFRARLSHHSAGVLDVCFDENYIVSCSKDTTICIWDRKTMQLVRQLQGHKGPVNAVAIRGNQVVSASGDALVKLWDIPSGECIREFNGHNRGLACVQFSEDASTIVSGGNDQDIRVWDVRSGLCLKTLTGHKDLVRTLHLDSRNRRIISGSYDASVKVWNLDSGKLILDIKHFHSTWILAAKADHKRIVSTSQDSRSLVLDFSMGVKGLELLE